MKKTPFEMIAVIVAATLVCFTIILLAINMNAKMNTETAVVEETAGIAYIQYIPAYSLGETFTIETTITVPAEESIEEYPTADEQQIMEDAEDAILDISEQIGELEQELDHIEDDIDDEEDADDIFDDIDDAEEQAQDVLYSISKWNNYLIDIEEADSLREDLDYLQIKADNILDDCNDLEDDAEDL